MAQSYRPDIDGLRAFAVLSVIFYHAGFASFGGGYLGVDIFFVISGYLISNIIVSDVKNGNFSFVRFYERRIRRIIPALLFTILWCFPLAWLFLSPVDFKDFSQSIVASLGSVSNFLFWHEADYFDTSTKLKPLIHTWSLAIEEQFYFIYPPLVVIIWRFFKNQLAIVLSSLVVISLITAHISTMYSQDTSFYLLHTRAWELLAGAWIGYFSLQNPVKFRSAHVYFQFVGVLLLIIPVLFYDEGTHHPGLATTIPVLGAMILLLYGASESPLRRLFSNRFSVGVGLISYSLYLVHQPVFSFANHLSIAELTREDYLVLILVSFMLAFVSYKLVETTFRNKNLVSNKLFYPVTVFVALVLTAVGLAGHVSGGYPARFDSSFNPIFAAQKNIEPTVDGVQCHGTFPETLCVIGASNNDSPNWALIGDSHAGSFGHALDEMLKEIGASGFQLTTGGCSYAISLVKDGANCLEVNDQVRQKILSSNIKNIVLAGRYVRNLELAGFDNREGGIEPTNQDSSFFPLVYSSEQERRDLILKSYSSSIEELVNADKNIFLVYPIPEVGWDVPRQKFKLRLQGLDKQITTSSERYYERSITVINIFDNIPDSGNLFRIRPDEMFCDQPIPGRCVTEIDDNLLYFDDDHLTTFGTKFIVQQILNSSLRAISSQDL